MNKANALKTYQTAEIESSVMSADSHKLILLLYQGALLAVASAKNQILRNEIAAKGASISHAIAIIESGLRASLDITKGGQLAQNLSDLYTYMLQRLLAANLNNDISALNEVSKLLLELRTAWESINPKKPLQPTLPGPQLQAVPSNNRTAFVYGKA